METATRRHGGTPQTRCVCGGRTRVPSDAMRQGGSSAQSAEGETDTRRHGFSPLPRRGAPLTQSVRGGQTRSVCGGRIRVRGSARVRWDEETDRVRKHVKK